MRAAFAERGRDEVSLQIRGRLTVARDDSGAVDIEATAADAAALISIGVTDVNVALQVLDADPDRAADLLAPLMAAFRTLS